MFELTDLYAQFWYFPWQSTPTVYLPLVCIYRDYEEKVVALEGEVARWEQKYLEESALRQMAVDAASVPKDARIAALERNSLETERLITQVGLVVD